MDWGNEPATEQQLACLGQFGYIPDHDLTKREASEIIHGMREQTQTAQAQREAAQQEAHALRVAVENAGRAVNSAAGDQREKYQQDLALAVAKRQEFWLDTCREPTQMHARSPQVLELYKSEGCRFVTPTHEQAQEVLGALDAIMAEWDKDHPELFYQTLELNFSELLRHI